MSVDATSGIAGSAAGSPLAQSAGSDVARAQHGVASQKRHAAAAARAAGAEGIAEADGEDHRSGERDPDGRRIWILDASKRGAVEPGPISDADRPPSPEGDCGGRFDASG